MPLELEIAREQLIPVALLYAAGHSIEGKTRFQKLAFLLDKDELGDDFKAYDFRKYDYGPASKRLLRDVKQLEREGVVTINKTRTVSGNTRYEYELEGNWPKDVEDLSEVEDIRAVFETALHLIQEHGDKPLREVIEYIYEKYPEYKENSVYKY